MIDLAPELVGTFYVCAMGLAAMIVHSLACRNKLYLRIARKNRDAMVLVYTMLAVPVVSKLMDRYPALKTLPIDPFATLLSTADGRRDSTINVVDLSTDRIVTVIYVLLAFLYLLMLWRQWNSTTTDESSDSGESGKIDRHHDTHDWRRRIVSVLAVTAAFIISILFTLGPPSRSGSSIRAIAVDPSSRGDSPVDATNTTIGSEGADTATVEALGTQVGWASPHAIGPTAVVSGTVATPNVEQPGRRSPRFAIELLAPANNATVGPSTAMLWRLTQPLAQGDRIEILICRSSSCTGSAIVQSALEGRSVGPTSAGTYSWIVQRTSRAGTLVASHRYWFVVDLAVVTTPGVMSSYPTAIAPSTGSHRPQEEPKTRPVKGATAGPAATNPPLGPTEMPTSQNPTSEPTPQVAPPVPSTTSPTEESPPVAPPVPTK